MSKRKKRKNKKTYHHEYYSYSMTYSDTENIRSIARQVFGSSDYINYDSLNDL